MPKKNITPQKKSPKRAPVPVKESKKIKQAEPKEQPSLPVKTPRYFYGLGKRKTAVAQVQLFKNGQGKIRINNCDWQRYFPDLYLEQIIESPLKVAGQRDKVDLLVKVKGGGKRAQAEAVRLGIARTLVSLNPLFKKALKKYRYLTRDSRVKERKKYGLKRARRAPQWSKR